MSNKGEGTMRSWLILCLAMLFAAPAGAGTLAGKIVLVP